jgi:hypothetical protein
MNELRLTVRDTAGIRKLRPVTGGVPIAEGAAPEGSVFALRDDDEKPVPVQTSVLARWRDGSARWVLLGFQANPAADGEQRYVLHWGDALQPVGPDMPVCSVGGDDVALRSGEVTVSVGGEDLLNLADRFDVALSLTDADGELCEATVESAGIETSGALRSTLALVGSFGTQTGKRLFQFRLRASVYAGLSLVRLEPMVLVDADAGVIQRVHDLWLRLCPRSPAGRTRIGGAPGWDGHADYTEALFQVDDAHCLLEGTLDGEGSKAPGWAELEDADGVAALALRDFWQQWPKALDVSQFGLSVGLLPDFSEGDFAHLEPWYKHQYLFDGDCYRLRTGQARRWDIWVDLGGDGESLAKHVNAPLVPIADPGQAIATGVWDEIAPAGTPAMAEYDAWAENLFSAYCHSIEVERDYGAMNWGDWFGERHVNWGNHEYDTTNQILIQFARTGDPRYLHAADAAARHSAEVDTVHHVNPDLAAHFGPRDDYPARPGMVHQHTVGHVSGFYSNEQIRQLLVEHGVGDSPAPYLCVDPYNLGHIWTQGLVRHYFLTGDPFLKETVEKIGENLAQLVEDGQYPFLGHSHCGRTAGWTLLALAGAYELDFDDRYLTAMRSIADGALAEQDPVCGGWLYSLPRGHCYCEKAKHVGMAGFITAVLVNGLSRYYLLTGDERLPDAIGRAVTFLDNDTWRDERSDWRYTSCPASNLTHQPGVVVMAHVNAVRIANDPEHLRILRLAWQAKFRRLLETPKPGPGQGKAFSSTLYGCAEAVGLLATRGAGT